MGRALLAAELSGVPVLGWSVYISTQPNHCAPKTKK